MEGNSMDWTQVLTIIASNIGLILWVRSESRADYRHLEQKTLQLITGIKEDVSAMHQEMKDFHGRLCSLEEKMKNNVQK
jgi:hypothetical protein